MIIEKARPHHSGMLQRELQELMSNVFQHVRRKITSDRIRQNLVVLFFICPNMALSSLSTTEPFDIDSPACYTLLNGTGTIGCRSLRQHGEAHPVSIIETAADLDFFSKSDSQEKRIILLSKELFTRENLLLLEQSGKCGGVLLEWSANIPDEYSPDVKYQYCSCDDSTDCDHAWNSAGDGVAAEDFDFPILALTPGASTEVRSSAQQSSLLENSIRSHPQYVVELDYYMDVFQGYRFANGAWWQLQPFPRCCSTCAVNCGAKSCCKTSDGYTCISPANSSPTWQEPVCARRASPTAYSCIEQQTCLPIGGYNVWALIAREMPLPPTRRIVMVAAAADSSALFHDLAAGAVANDASVIALLAAATALRGWREELEAPGSAALLLALFQAEAWDHVGSRRQSGRAVACLHPPCASALKSRPGRSLAYPPAVSAPPLDPLSRDPPPCARCQAVEGARPGEGWGW